MRKQCLHPPNRTFDANCEYEVECRLGHFLDRLVVNDGGVVDDRIEAAGDAGELARGGHHCLPIGDIRDQPVERFKIKPETNSPATWVKPDLVCEVVFHGWTIEGVMRQPVFLRLREDKTAREVERDNVGIGAKI